MAMLPFITGAAEGLTKAKQAEQEADAKRQQAAYESLLRRQEEAMPRPLPPSQVALQQAQTRAIPQEMELAKQQEARLKQQQQSTELKNLFDRQSAITNKDTGGPIPGSEIEYYTNKAKLLSSASPAFLPGGQLEKGDGKTPHETAFLNAARKFSKEPTEANWKEVMTVSGATPGVAETEKPTKFQLQKEAQDEAFRQLGGSYMVGLTPESKEEYNRLTKEIYQQYLTQYGYTETSAKPTLSPTNLSNDITATNPKTGEKMIFRNGKWQSLTK